MGEESFVCSDSGGRDDATSTGASAIVVEFNAKFAPFVSIALEEVNSFVVEGEMLTVVGTEVLKSKVGSGSEFLQIQS